MVGFVKGFLYEHLFERMCTILYADPLKGLIIMLYFLKSYLWTKCLSQIKTRTAFLFIYTSILSWTFLDVQAVRH